MLASPEAAIRGRGGSRSPPAMTHVIPGEERHRLTATTGIAALGLDALASCAYGCECRQPCHRARPASPPGSALVVTVQHYPSMICECGPRTCLPDARSHAVLAGAARPLRHRQGRRDPDPAPRGLRVAPHQPPAHPDLDRRTDPSPR